MIKIRYAELPRGLHADVRTCGQRPVIYLLPGLSAAQRRDALGRLIRASRLGHGPRLRASGVAFAVARDVAKSTGGNGLAAIRCHPAGSAVLAALVAAVVVCYALFVTVTVRFSPRPAGPPAAAGPAPSASRDTAGPGRSPGAGARAPAVTPPAVAGKHGGSPEAAASGSGAGQPAPGSSGSGPATSSVPLPTGTWSAPGGVLPSAAQPAPSATPSPVPSPAPPRQPRCPAARRPGRALRPGGSPRCLYLRVNRYLRVPCQRDDGRYVVSGVRYRLARAGRQARPSVRWDLSFRAARTSGEAL